MSHNKIIEEHSDSYSQYAAAALGALMGMKKWNELAGPDREALREEIAVLAKEYAVQLLMHELNYLEKAGLGPADQE